MPFFYCKSCMAALKGMQKVLGICHNCVQADQIRDRARKERAAHKKKSRYSFMKAD